MSGPRDTTGTAIRLAAVGFASVLLAATLPGGAALAQDAPASVERGMRFAEQNCTKCHAVHTGELGPFGDVPTFEAVAATPGVSALALSAFFRTSHNDMPNFIIAPDDTRDVVAYILSLKQPR